MQKNRVFVGTLLCLLVFVMSASVASATLTLDATSITSDAAMTLTTASGSNLTVTRGIGFANATSTDSLYVGGVTQLTGATASSTALVIGADVPLFRNSANQLRLQGTLSVSAGGTFNAATTTDSLYVGGLAWHGAATASSTALVIGADVPLFRSSANTLTVQGNLGVANVSLSNGALVYGDTGTATACAGGAATLDLSTGNFFNLDMTSAADCTITFAGGVAGGIYVIELQWAGANNFILADLTYQNVPVATLCGATMNEDGDKSTITVRARSASAVEAISGCALNFETP